MIPGYSSPGLAPMTIPDAADESVPSPFMLLRRAFEAERNYLVEAKPFDPDPGVDDEVDFFFADSEVFLDTHYPLRVDVAIEYEARIAIESITPDASASLGNISIYVNDGDDHTFARYYWDCRPVTVYMGGPGFARFQYGPVQSGMVRDAIWSEARDGDLIELVMQDATLRLQQPLSQTKFAGNGDEDIEGDANLKGQRRPMAFGPCKNITPVLVNQSSQGQNVYQWHEGQSNALLAIYDEGVQLPAPTVVGDVFAHVFDQAEIDGNIGVYQLDLSLVRLADEPLGLITLDVEGEATTGLGGYVSTASEVAIRMARILGLALTDLAGFNNIDTAKPYDVSYYQAAGNNVTALTAMRQVMASVNAGVYGDRLGRIRASALRLGTSAPDAVIREEHIHSIDRGIPPISAKTLTIGYDRSWTVQETPAENAALAHKDFIKIPLRKLTPAVDAATTDDRLAARDIEIDTLLVNEADAITEQTQRFNFLKALRHVYTVEVSHQQHLLEPGAVVELSYPKFGLDAGRQFVVFQVRDSTAGTTTTLGLWG